MCYPQNDTEYEDQTIESVTPDKEGSYTIQADGWSLWCGADCPVTPEPGQTVRTYGRGIGFSVRGLFIDGVRIWYRSNAEDKEHREIENYGRDAKDWLARWDRGDSCWTIEMGGLGPAYEQCIHITCAEILRWLIENNSDANKWPSGGWEADRERMEADVSKVKVVKDLGLSGAQWVAAVNLATMLYKNGPRGVMADERVKDCHILVSKSFPGSAAA